MSIVVGYIPTREGRAALRRAAAEAELRKADLIVINSDSGKNFDLMTPSASRPRSRASRAGSSRPASTSRFVS